MTTEMGEYIVGAYLQVIEKCQIINYNVREQSGGHDSLNELDVVGINFIKKKVFLCEVTTHITGLLYKTNEFTIKKIKQKHEWQKIYAEKYLSNFECEFMFFSPYVPKGYREDELYKIQGLKIIINKTYDDFIEELKKFAKSQVHDTGNPAFRMLQILEHTKK